MCEQRMTPAPDWYRSLLKRRMMLPRAMLFLPEIEDRLDWGEVCWDIEAEYLDRKQALYKWHWEAMEQRHLEFYGDE